MCWKCAGLELSSPSSAHTLIRAPQLPFWWLHSSPSHRGCSSLLCMPEFTFGRNNEGGRGGGDSFWRMLCIHCLIISRGLGSAWLQKSMNNGLELGTFTWFSHFRCWRQTRGQPGPRFDYFLNDVHQNFPKNFPNSSCTYNVYIIKSGLFGAVHRGVFLKTVSEILGEIFGEIFGNIFREVIESEPWIPFTAK